MHHYLHVDGMEQGCFMEALSSLSSLIEEYSQLDATKDRLMPDAARLNIATLRSSLCECVSTSRLYT